MCASLFDFSFPKILNRAVDRFPFSQNSKTNGGGGHVRLCHENSRMLPTGMRRDEVVRRGLIRGEIPIYGTAGLAAALSRAMQREGDK
jgi:hypothetical protein